MCSANGSFFCVTFAESEPYCHSILFVCLDVCLDVCRSFRDLLCNAYSCHCERDASCHMTCIYRYRSKLSPRKLLSRYLGVYRSNLLDRFLLTFHYRLLTGPFFRSLKVRCHGNQFKGQNWRNRSIRLLSLPRCGWMSNAFLRAQWRLCCQAGYLSVTNGLGKTTGMLGRNGGVPRRTRLGPVRL